MTSLKDLPDNMFDQVVEGRESILNIIEPHSPNTQVMILELLLTETIYFNTQNKNERMQIVKDIAENIIYNFSIWDEKLATYNLNE